jgi:hypothetical protein
MTISPAPDSLAELSKVQQEIELIFPPFPIGGNYRQAPTGEEYVVIMNGGIKEEGRNIPCLAWTEQDSIRLWKEAVLQYAAGKTGVLYWREKPELAGTEMFWEGYDAKTNRVEKYGASNVMWRVYSRLLISDKTPIQTPKWSGTDPTPDER